MLQNLLQNLRHAARQLSARPGFTLFAVCSLAIGMAASITLFSAANTFLFAPLRGLGAPDRLVELGSTRHGNSDDTFSAPDFGDYATRAKPFADVFAYRHERINVDLAGEPQPRTTFADRTSRAEQLIGAFATLALVLAAIGIYGVLAFAVAQRSGEFGVRMAIGADTGRIRRQVLGAGARLTGLGLGLGVLGAVVLGFILRSQLFGVGAVDLPSLSIVIVVLAATALFACWLPARRAARTPPLDALRYE